MGASDRPLAEVRRLLLEGQVIPAHPLALTSARALDERRQAALTRYYCDAGAGGNFDASDSLSQAQNDFLTTQISSVGTVAVNLNTATAQNGYAYNQLQSASAQQDSLATLYTGFINKIQKTNMAEAATQLSLNQTALQAVLQVTSGLNQLTLLNYLPKAGG